MDVDLRILDLGIRLRANHGFAPGPFTVADLRTRMAGHDAVADARSQTSREMPRPGGKD